MKILLAADSLVRGGMERRMLELIKGLVGQKEFSLKLVVFSDTIDYPEIYDLEVPVVILKRVPKRNPLVFHRFYKICKQWKPDLIHSWGTMSAIWAIPTSVLLKIPLINGNIVDAPDKMAPWDKRLFRARLTYPFSKVVVGNSEAGLRAYRVPFRKSICIYNGIDRARFSKLRDVAEMRREIPVHTEQVVGMVGSFSKRKDYATFIKAGMLLLDHGRDITLIAVGDGPELQRHLQMVPPDRSQHFVFTGMRTDVESVINLFDVGVLATNAEIHGEGISNVILEYMALEIPVVATQGGGTSEILEQGKTGLLVEPGSAEEMADAISYLLDNEKEASEMGIAGSEIVNSRFSLSRMTQDYVELYQRVTGDFNSI